MSDETFSNILGGFLLVVFVAAAVAGVFVVYDVINTAVG